MTTISGRGAVVVRSRGGAQSGAKSGAQTGAIVELLMKPSETHGSGGGTRHGKTRRCKTRRDKSGFTLLEVMIAMSILALGATSILSVFVAAVSFQTQRVENNRLTDLRNFVRHHAQVRFNNYDPKSGKKGQKPIPPKVVVDLTDPEVAIASPDPLVREAAELFPGFRYEIIFEEDQFSVSGSSVVAHIRIFRLSGQLDESELVDKEFLTRSGIPYHEFFHDSNLSGMTQAERDSAKRGLDDKRK